MTKTALTACDMTCWFLFFFFLGETFFIISGRLITLQYCSGFVIYWHESAMDLHVFPIPIPPPDLLVSRSDWEYGSYRCQRSMWGTLEKPKSPVPLWNDCWNPNGEIHMCFLFPIISLPSYKMATMSLCFLFRGFQVIRPKQKLPKDYASFWFFFFP